MSPTFDGCPLPRNNIMQLLQLSKRKLLSHLHKIKNVQLQQEIQRLRAVGSSWDWASWKDSGLQRAAGGWLALEKKNKEYPGFLEDWTPSVVSLVGVILFESCVNSLWQILKELQPNLWMQAAASLLIPRFFLVSDWFTWMPLFAVSGCQSHFAITTLRPSIYSRLHFLTLPSYFCSFLSHQLCRHSLRSHAFITFSVLYGPTQVGRWVGGGVFPPSVNASLLGLNAAGSEAQFAPVLKFYTHFKHSRKSCECTTVLSTSTCQVYHIVLVFVLGKQICEQQMVATFFYETALPWKRELVSP